MEASFIIKSAPIKKTIPHEPFAEGGDVTLPEQGVGRGENPKDWHQGAPRSCLRGPCAELCSAEGKMGGQNN